MLYCDAAMFCRRRNDTVKIFGQERLSIHGRSPLSHKYHNSWQAPLVLIMFIAVSVFRVAHHATALHSDN